MKQRSIKQILKICVLIFVVISLYYHCAQLIARFDPAALENAISLKEEALSLIEKADEPYEKHREEINVLVLKLDRAFQYARDKPKNELSAKQWEILKNFERHLLGGFLLKWQQEKQLKPVFITEAKKSIAAAFDSIIQLEKGKRLK